MKKASELGLELIELEDQVLLVDRNIAIKHIASTKPLEGLPLLVIEDELSEHEIFMVKSGVLRDDIINWKKGYNKAKEVYKFTEKDLRKAYMYGLCQEKAFEEVMSELTKKELWIEVECNKVLTRNPPIEVFGPKITNNQIKGIWK